MTQAVNLIKQAAEFIGILNFLCAFTEDFRLPMFGSRNEVGQKPINGICFRRLVMQVGHDLLLSFV